MYWIGLIGGLPVGQWKGRLMQLRRCIAIDGELAERREI